MREILFRGKWTDNGEWVASGNVRLDGKRKYIYIPNPLDEMGARAFLVRDVIPSTVGQYTGLTDKNGTKIFEGDVVKVEYTGVNKGLNGIAEVIFDKCKFALVWGWHKEIVCLADFCNVEFEVIGNIHDNPELLESGVEGE